MKLLHTCYHTQDQNMSTYTDMDIDTETHAYKECMINRDLMTITNDHNTISKISHSHNHVINTQEIWSNTEMLIDIDQMVDDLSDTIKGAKLLDLTQDKPPTNKEELENFKKKLVSPSNS